MKTTKKVLALLLAVLLCLSCLAACGGDGQSGQGDSTPSQDNTAGSGSQSGGASSGEPLTIWVEKVFSDDANNRMDEAIKKYSADTGVAVKVEFINSTDFVTKLNAAVEANNHYPEISDLVNDIHAENPFMQSVYDIAQIDGKFYFVPYSSSADLLYIRKDKMEAAGVSEIPKTWDELFALGEKITDPANDFYGIGMSAGQGDGDAENAMRVMMWNNGGGLFNADGTPNANNEVNRGVFGKYLELYQNGTIPESAISWTGSDNNGNYLLGSVGIVVNACTLYTAMRDNEDYKELLENTIITNIPAGTDNNKKMAYLYGWGIHDTCKDVDAAKELIRYLCTEEVITDYIEKIAPVYAPVFVNVGNSPTWSDGVYKTMIDYVSTCDAYVGYPCNDVETLAVASQVYNAYAFTNALNSMVAGNMIVEEALEYINSEITKTAEAIQK